MKTIMFSNWRGITKEKNYINKTRIKFLKNWKVIEILNVLNIQKSIEN